MQTRERSMNVRPMLPIEDRSDSGIAHSEAPGQLRRALAAVLAVPGIVLANVSHVDRRKLVPMIALASHVGAIAAFVRAHIGGERLPRKVADRIVQLAERTVARCEALRLWAAEGLEHQKADLDRVAFAVSHQAHLSIVP